MAFTDKDFEDQQEQLRQLEDELLRLNTQFDAQMKAGGITATDLAAIDAGKLPAEVRTAFEAAQQAARREGESRAAQSRPAAGGGAAKAPGAGRRGAVRL